MPHKKLVLHFNMPGLLDSQMVTQICADFTTLLFGPDSWLKDCGSMTCFEYFEQRQGAC